jgi:hypothetical protein
MVAELRSSYQSEFPVRGYIAASSWGRTWFEHVLELERVRLTRAGKPAGEVDQALKVFAQFYDFYLNQKLTPGEVIDRHPDWKNSWYDERDGPVWTSSGFLSAIAVTKSGGGLAENELSGSSHTWHSRQHYD